ncbi:MAG: hypothetical protein ACXQT4_05715 [Methanotrichaceae archaeon]
MSDDFDKMSREDQITYLIENLRNLPEDLVNSGIDLLIGAGETEYAIALAKDTGRTEKAIEIAVDEGDYLWAALIAKKAGLKEESQRLYKEGQDYYVSMNMYGRAVGVARALKLPQHEIDRLYEAGIRAESRKMDIRHARAALDNVAMTLESALMGMDDEMTKDVRNAMNEEMKKTDRRASEDIDD